MLNFVCPVVQWSEIERTVFSDEQIDIFEMKVNGSSVSDICAKYKISKSSLYVSIMQTHIGNRWEPSTSKGGAPSYLGDVDEGYLINEVEKRAIDMN